MRQRSVWTKRLVLSAVICVATIFYPFSSSGLTASVRRRTRVGLASCTRARGSARLFTSPRQRPTPRRPRIGGRGIPSATSTYTALMASPLKHCWSRVTISAGISLKGRSEEHAQVLGAEHALSEHDLAARDPEPAVHHAQHVLASPDEEILLRLQ